MRRTSAIPGRCSNLTSAARLPVLVLTGNEISVTPRFCNA